MDDLERLLAEVRSRRPGDGRPNRLAGQLLAAGACGALGAVAVALPLNAALVEVLGLRFRLPLLAGGVTLLTLAVVRALALGLARGRSWRLVSRGEAAWRSAVLSVPVFLFVLGLPPEGYVREPAVRVPGLSPAEVEWAQLSGVLSSSYRGPLDVLPWLYLEAGTEIDLVVTLSDLGKRSFTSEEVIAYQSKRVRVKGQFAPGQTPGKFTLVRYRYPRDSESLSVVVVDNTGADRMPNFNTNAWVEVTGRVRFHPLRIRNQWDRFVPVLHVEPTPQVPLSRLVTRVPPKDVPRED